MPPLSVRHGKWRPQGPKAAGAQLHSHYRYKRHSSQEEAELIQQIGANIKERQNVFFDMEAYLPKKNG